MIVSVIGGDDGGVPSCSTKARHVSMLRSSPSSSQERRRPSSVLLNYRASSLPKRVAFLSFFVEFLGSPPGGCRLSGTDSSCPVIPDIVPCRYATSTRYAPSLQTPFAPPPPPHPRFMQAPPPPPNPASATETPLSSGTRGTNQPGDLLSSDLPQKEQAVTETVTGERQRGVIDSSPSKGSGGQDIAAEAGEERAGGGKSEGGGEHVAEGIAQEEGSEGAVASGRAGEGSRDSESEPREAWGGQGQEAVGGAGDAGGERREEEEQRENTPPQGSPVSVGQPQRGGTGEGAAAGASTASKEERKTLSSSSVNEANGEQTTFANAGGNVPSGGVSLGGGVPLEEGGSVERRSRGEIAGDGDSGRRGTVPDSTDQEREGETEMVFGGDSQPSVVLGEGGVAAPAPAVVSADTESGGGSGTAPEGGDSVDGPVDKYPALVGVEGLESEAKEGEGDRNGGVHEGRPTLTPLEAHEGEPGLEGVASETTVWGGRGSPATDEKKGRYSAVAAEDKGGETDGGLLIKTSLTGEDSNGRRRDSKDDGLRGSPDASTAGLEVTPPHGEGRAPDDGRGEGAAPVLGGGEGSDEGRGGAVSAAKVLDDGGAEEDVVFLQVRRRLLVVALWPSQGKAGLAPRVCGFHVCCWVRFASVWCGSIFIPPLLPVAHHTFTPILFATASPLRGTDCLKFELDNACASKGSHIKVLKKIPDLDRNIQDREPFFRSGTRN